MPVMCCFIQSVSVLLKPSINDCSDLTKIRLRKFSISLLFYSIFNLQNSYNVGNNNLYDVALDTIHNYLKDTLFSTLKFYSIRVELQRSIPLNKCH